MIRFYLDDYYEITDYIDNKGFDSFNEKLSTDSLQIENITFTCFNEDNFFSVCTPTSFFYNTEIQNIKLKIVDENKTLYESYIKDIKIDSEQDIATIETETVLNRALNSYVVGWSENLTPPEIILLWLEEFQLQDRIDYPSFNRAKDYYTNNNVILNYNLEIGTQTTLFEFISAITNTVNASVYVNENKIKYYNYIYTESQVVATTLNDSDIIEEPKIYTDFDGLFNDYYIKTYSGFECLANQFTDFSSQELRDLYNKSKRSKELLGYKTYSINASKDDQIQINSINAGYTIGTDILFDKLRNKKYIEFAILKDKNYIPNLKDYVYLNFTELGFINKLVKIVEITYSYNQVDKVSIKGEIYG